jgi:hypothetical protein
MGIKGEVEGEGRGGEEVSLGKCRWGWIYDLKCVCLRRLSKIPIYINVSVCSLGGDPPTGPNTEL